MKMQFGGMIMIDRSYAEYAWEQTAEILSVDSPTGFTEKAASWVPFPELHPEYLNWKFTGPLFIFLKKKFYFCIYLAVPGLS